MRLLLLIAALALPAVSVSFSSPPLPSTEGYSAEEFLAWDGAVDPISRTAALEIIQARRQLILRQEAADFRRVPTVFGTRLDEPEALKKFRAEEHKKIRSLLPRGREKDFQSHRSTWLQEIEKARAAFPLLPNPPLSLQTTFKAEQVLVELTLSAPSPLYHLEIDQVTSEKDAAVVRATWVRPPLGELIGHTPEPASITRPLQLAPQPRLELWLRTRDEDLPFRTEYLRVLNAPLTPP